MVNNYLTVSEVSKLAGVSVRTLHFYDEKGLLSPSQVGKSGCRFYGDAELKRLERILLYRELDFSLAEIVDLLEKPDDANEALKGQRKLLELKKKRLELIIDELDKMMNGADLMNLKAFDNSEYEKEQSKYAAEVRERWGETKQYGEFSTKQASMSDEDKSEAALKGDEIMASFGECVGKGLGADSAEAQQLAADWQAYITKYHYECTKPILSGLAQMYVGDERFKNNIDRFGNGTAELMSAAILKYCEN